MGTKAVCNVVTGNSFLAVPGTSCPSEQNDLTALHLRFFFMWNGGKNSSCSYVFTEFSRSKWQDSVTSTWVEVVYAEVDLKGRWQGGGKVQGDTARREAPIGV